MARVERKGGAAATPASPVSRRIDRKDHLDVLRGSDSDALVMLGEAGFFTPSSAPSPSWS